MTLASCRGDGVVSAPVAPFPDAGVASFACAAQFVSDRCAERIDMPVIKVDNLQYPLRPGQNRLGSGEDADVPVEGDVDMGIQAIVEVTGNSQAVIRRSGRGAIVRVNGVTLVEPTPLMHGDKVEIGGRELLYADDTKTGNTGHVAVPDIARTVARRPSGRATAATGGRLVSLVDGKEYAIPSTGLVIGRDASANVVVAQNEVSRKHAEIAAIEGGYEVRDFSANGVFVNGVRIDTSQLLSRSDVIRIGSEEFRFYADVRPAAPSLDATVVPQGASSAKGRRTPVMASEALAASQPSPVAAPATQQRSDGRPLLGVLEIVNPGPTKGQKFDVCVPLVHVGRGAHNDIVLSDESVSDTHAKLQRREDGWYICDVGSTNGTYVGGQRVATERKLDGSPDVRFGGVKMVFRPADTVVGPAGGTRAIASVDRGTVRPNASSPTPVRVSAPVASTAPAPTPSNPSLPIWVWGLVVLAIGAVIAFFLLNR